MGVIDKKGVPLDRAKDGIYVSGVGRGWGIGKVVPGRVKTTKAMIKNVGLDWNVDQPLLSDYVPFENAERFRMNVRGDTQSILGVVGKDWRSPSNAEAFDFVDSLLDSGDAKWLAGGALEKGRTIFGLAQIQDPIVIGGEQDESTLPLLFLRNGWDGGTALTIQVSMLRLICANGMVVPVDGHVRVWRMRHTSSLVGRMEEARKTLELAIGYISGYEDEMNKLVETSFTDGEFEKLVAGLIPLPVADTSKEDGGIKLRRAGEARELLTQVYQESETVAPVKGTRYGALNAVTEYMDWHAGVRQPSDERRFVRSMDDGALTGHVPHVKARAMQLLRV